MSTKKFKIRIFGQFRKYFFSILFPTREERQEKTQKKTQ